MRMTPLLRASERGGVTVVKALIEAGANLEEMNHVRYCY
jgi:ankyrin repeat protein